MVKTILCLPIIVSPRHHTNMKNEISPAYCSNCRWIRLANTMKIFKRALNSHIRSSIQITKLDSTELQKLQFHFKSTGKSLQCFTECHTNASGICCAEIPNAKWTRLNCSTEIERLKLAVAGILKPLHASPLFIKEALSMHYSLLLSCTCYASIHPPVPNKFLYVDDVHLASRHKADLDQLV